MVEMTVTRIDGNHEQLSDSDVSAFTASISGGVLSPDGSNARYDEARSLWNGMIDRKPALIAQCANARDVVNAVKFAREKSLLVSVRGGDHSAAGNAMVDGGLAIDLSPMNQVTVDPSARTAIAGGGARWIDFDTATLKHGLATTGGTNSDTGVGGLTLGGGIGWLSGKYGLTCDNLISAEVVTANGDLLTASEHENSDLFWGLRGGSGNFGIVTSFKLQVHPVGNMLGGLVIHPVEKAPEVLRFHAEFSADIPDELNTVAAMLYSPDGDPVVAIGLCYNGPIEKGEAVIEPVRKFGPPLVDQVGPMPYSAIQAMLTEGLPRGRRYYWKANFLDHISGELIDDLAGHYSAVPSPFSLIAFQQFGNATRRVPIDATAFSHRDASYDCIAISGWEDPADDDKNIAWTREFFEISKKSSTGGLYVNSVVESDAASLRAAYKPATYERLARLKSKYDPINFFRNNPNIKPG